MIPSVLASQLITGVKDFLTTTFPSSTPAFFDMMKDFGQNSTQGLKATKKFKSSLI